MYDELVCYVRDASDKATFELKLTLDNSIKKDKIERAIYNAQNHLEAQSILDTLIEYAIADDIEATEILTSMLGEKERALEALLNDTVRSIYQGNDDYWYDNLTDTLAGMF